MNKLRKNVVWGFAKQVVAIIYGFILPRLILAHYGSEVNGLINSITQFLQMISYLDMGMGTVVQSALYLPLAQSNNRKISEIMSSARKFFRTIASILLVYVVALMLIYPNTIKGNFDYWYVTIIIISLSINSFAQYYFGIVNATLLRADQRGYIYDSLSVLTYVISTMAGVIIISLGGSIQVLEFTTSIIYLMRPLYISLYVKKNYQVNYSVKYAKEPITQKWNGIAQHFSAVVIDGTDIVVLTLFSTLQNVSVYSVYNLVVTGVRTLVLSITHGMSAYFGRLIAEGDVEKTISSFQKTDWIVNSVSIISFGCTSILIIPFVKLYTSGVNDVNYIVPDFAILITMAQLFRCIRLPYNVLILSAGHFKQTQSNYIIAAIINISISILMVSRFGLIGVAIGTLVAFIYQDVWMATYVSKNIINWPFMNFVRQNICNIAVIVPSYVLSKQIIISVETMSDWVIYAIIVVVIWSVVFVLVNMLLNKKMIMSVIAVLFAKVLRFREPD